MLPIDSLITPITRDQALALLLDLGASVGLPTTSWQPKGMIRTILVMVAQKIADVSQLISVIARGGFLDYATGGWLTLLAFYVYNVTRNPAVFASGVMSITNTSSSSKSYEVGSLHFTTALGFTYSNTARIDVPNNGIAVTVNASADVAGGSSSASAGTINALATPVIGITVTNALAFLGQDEESDPALRVRCRDKLGALSWGLPPGAYAYAAKTATTSVPITRVDVHATSTTGHVQIAVATDAGPVSGPDLAIADAAIQAVVTQCVTATTVSTTPLNVTPVIDVWVQGTTLNDAQIQAAVLLQFANYFRGAPIGGYVIAPAVTGSVQYNALIAAVFATPQANIVKATLTTPPGDLTLAALEVPTLVGGAVTVHHV